MTFAVHAEKHIHYLPMCMKREHLHRDKKQLQFEFEADSKIECCSLGI